MWITILTAKYSKELICRYLEWKLFPIKVSV